MHSLGDRIKELRSKRGLSQDELADKMNAQFGTAINKSMISKWENNLSEPKLETARLLALFFQESLDSLLELNNEIQTIAAHHDGEDWTEEELAEIERFKEFVKLKRKQQE